jgi:hypothetical protein
VVRAVRRRLVSFIARTIGRRTHQVSDGPGHRPVLEAITRNVPGHDELRLGQRREGYHTMLRTALLTASILAATPALAQNPQPTAPANPTVPVAPPNAPSPPPEKIAPPSGTLSDRLSQQKGTIAPPNVDPGMTVTPPRNGSATTPVIPPPGSPGGNRSVVPK